MFNLMTYKLISNFFDSYLFAFVKSKNIFNVFNLDDQQNNI